MILRKNLRLRECFRERKEKVEVLLSNVRETGGERGGERQEGERQRETERNRKRKREILREVTPSIHSV